MNQAAMMTPAFKFQPRPTDEFKFIYQFWNVSVKKAGMACYLIT
jgi:hypothetical protein